MVKRVRLVTKLLLPAVSLLFLFLSIPSAQAVTGKNNGVEIAPAVIDVTLKQADEELPIQLQLTNHTGKTITLELFPIDFEQKDENGTPGFLGENSGSYSYSLASFLSFETQSVTLSPGETRPFVVTVKNRQDLSPGGHYAAVVARLVSDKTPTASTVSPAVSSLILLRKTGGERYNLSLKNVDFPDGTVVLGYHEDVQLLFQNEGNVHLTPYGTAVIKDMFGRILYQGVLNTPSSKVLPESRRLISLHLRTLALSFPVSVNTFTINGTDSLQKTHFLYEQSFVYLNPWLASLFIILIVFILIWRRRSKHHDKEKTTHP